MSRSQFQLGDGDPYHGTVTGYDYYRCRCAACKEAWREYNIELRANRKASRPDPRVHPPQCAVSAATYRNWGCRCCGCCAANTAKMRRFRDLRKMQNKETT